MTAHDDAVKTAAEAILVRGRNWQVNGYMSESLAEAAVAAAAPILLAEAQTVFETLTVTSKARQEQVERLIAEVARWESLVDAKQSWIDGAKVDLTAAEEEAERLRAVALGWDFQAWQHEVGRLTAERDAALAAIRAVEAVFARWEGFDVVDEARAVIAEHYPDGVPSG